MLHTHVICCDCEEFRDEILLRGEEYKTRENFNFLKKGKMVIPVKNQNFTFFEVTRVTCDMRQVLNGSHCGTCQVVSKSNNELK